VGGGGGVAKSGVSSAYQNAGSMLADWQSMMAVTIVGSSAETNMLFFVAVGVEERWCCCFLDSLVVGHVIYDGAPNS
jgi:hypothetical protein